MKENKNNILFLVQFSVLLAIEALVCFTPLGSIPIGPLVATIALIPVTITSIVLGTKAGSLMGFFAGLFSFMVWTFAPPNPLTAFVFTPFYQVGEFSGNFSSLIICFVPRILTGTIAGLLFNLFKNLMGKRKDVLYYSIIGVASSLVNTVGVLCGIYIFFGKSYATTLGVDYTLLLGLIMSTVLTNGVLEAVLSAVGSYGIAKPIRKYVNKY